MKKLLLLTLVLLGGFSTAFAENMYIVGSAFGGWHTYTGVSMTDNGDGTFTYEYTPASNTNATFCIASALTSGTTDDWSTFNSNSFRPASKGTKFVQFEPIELNSTDGLNSVGMDFKKDVTYTFKFTKSTKKLVVLSSVVPDLYLRSNIDATEENSWKTWDAAFSELSDYMFTSYGWDSSSEKLRYSYNVTSENLANLISIGQTDLYFRIQNDDNDMPQIRPNGSDYTFDFSDGKYAEGQNGWSNNNKTTGKGSIFIVSHSSIKAAEYKITVYVGCYNWGRSYNTSVEIVSMPATVSALGYSTFSCGRALDLDNATGGLKAYKASVSDGKVVLTKVSGKVAAETGLLLAGTANASETIPVVTTAEGTDISTTNLLKACVNGGTVTKSGTDDKYHYFLAGSTAENIGFYNLATDTECGAGKAYLETTSPLATEGTGGARASWVFQDEEQETDGIQTAKAVTYNDNVYYDLQGRKVAYPTKGLYIINGKKVVVK